MAYVRSKRIKGHTYYYLVEGYREGKKVRQRVLAYLGSSDPTPARVAEAKAAHAAKGQQDQSAEDHPPSDEKAIRNAVYESYRHFNLTVRHNLRSNTNGRVITRNGIPRAVSLVKAPSTDTLVHELGHVVDHTLRHRSADPREKDKRFGHIYADGESASLAKESQTLAQMKYSEGHTELKDLWHRLETDGFLSTSDERRRKYLERFFLKYAYTPDEGFANAFALYVLDHKIALSVAPHHCEIISTLTNEHHDLRRTMEDLFSQEN